MKINLKNIKHSEFASHETSCFEATLYVDGKRFAYVSNAGQGGATDAHPIAPFTYKDIEALEKKIAKEYPKIVGDDYAFDTDLEIVCGDLLNEWLVNKTIKRVFKKVCCVENAASRKIFTWGSVAQAKNHGDAMRIQVLKKYPNAVILNDLPLEKARVYFSSLA